MLDESTRELLERLPVIQKAEAARQLTPLRDEAEGKVSELNAHFDTQIERILDHSWERTLHILEEVLPPPVAARLVAAAQAEGRVHIARLEENKEVATEFYRRIRDDLNEILQLLQP